MARFTDGTYPENTSPDDADILMSVDVSDTTDNAAGSSKHLTLAGLASYVSASGTFGKEVLVSDPTYFVATTGSDTTGDGSFGAPWASWQFAYDWIQRNVNVNGHYVAISMAAGTYDIDAITSLDSLELFPIEGVSRENPIQIDASNGQVTFTVASDYHIKAQSPVFLSFTSAGEMSFEGSGASVVKAMNGGYVYLHGVRFSCNGAQQIEVGHGGEVYLFNNIYVDTAGARHALIDGGRLVSNATMHWETSPNFSTRMYEVKNLGELIFSGASSGTVTETGNSTVDGNSIVNGDTACPGTFTATNGGLAFG
jgi:hypothetical protein